LLNPFPEEIVRRLVSRLSSLHLAPDPTSAANLAGRKGEVLETGGNTLRDSLKLALSHCGHGIAVGGQGKYIVASIHRSENLGRRGDLDLILEEIIAASALLPVNFVLHPVTKRRLEATGWAQRLKQTEGVMLTERTSYPEFVELMLGARLLMTDGGSNQEEAAMLGLPTILMRRATERHDGLDANVVLSGLDREVIRAFVKKHSAANWAVLAVEGSSPSERIVDRLEFMH
jgi:UDP-N-acetylglucosamine 2-epimerase (non-hydrolysing)